MKKLPLLFGLICVIGLNINALADCNTIQSGAIHTSDGQTITTGFDDWGYNYGAHIFNGTYCDAYRNADWCQPYSDISLLMKWNDAWTSTTDCDADGLLDLHNGYASYVGSGAWITNQQSGKVDVNGRMRPWNYFVKIVAVEPTDTLVNGVWMRDGRELGPGIWGEFAIVEEVYNDPSVGAHGILYRSPVGPGLGAGH